jgi:hypothetical protein
MTATQSTQRHGATLWRVACRGAAALRAIHDEQVLAWELVFQSSRLPADESRAARRPQTADCSGRRPARATAGAEVSTSGGSAHYQIRVEGVLDSQWAAWFGGVHIERDDTQTVISGSLADQPALHGLLTKIGDLGLCLISVRRLDPD